MISSRSKSPEEVGLRSTPPLRLARQKSATLRTVMNHEAVLPRICFRSVETVPSSCGCQKV